MSDALLKNIGVYDMVNYICAEHVFHASLLKPEARDELEKDKNYFTQLVNICYDKLIVNEYRSIDSRAVISKYSVETSLLTMFINRMFVLLGQVKINQNSAKQKLQVEFQKGNPLV